MPLETVIGQDAAQVRVIGEVDPEPVPGLALPPAGTAEEAHDGGHRLLLVGLELQPDALVEAHAEEVIDDLEAQLSVGIVDAANVAQDREVAVRIIAQKLHNSG